MGLRPFRLGSWGFYGWYALQGGGEEVVLAPGLLFEVAHAVSQLLEEFVAVVITITTMFVIMLICILGAALGAALVGTSDALVVAQYDVHAPVLAHMGDGAALYPGADGVHGDAEGLGGLGYR